MLLLTIGASALAHVGLEDPPPRYPSDGYDDNKSCPCGVGANNGLCSDLSNQSDPNRSTTVTGYDAGETITISAHEVVGHSGRWRIAFDPDGADLADFNANILLDIPDPIGSDGNVGQGDLWEFVVTLPNVSCTTCTLQIIQVMNGNTTDPVPDPTGESSYYQCADIELTGGPVDTGTPGTTETGADTSDTGTPPGTTDTDLPPGTTDTDVPADTDTAATPTDTGTDDESGCGCSDTGSGSLGAGGLLLAALWLRRRSPRRR